MIRPVPPGITSPDRIKSIGLKYQARFGNIDEIGHPAILFDPRFGALMTRAMQTGQALDQAAVNAVFKGIGWEQ